MDSIMQDIRECYITGDNHGLHKHHIYFGNPNRRIREAWGFWVWLPWDWHNGAEYGVHFNRDLDLRLKRACQERFEENHTRDQFRQIIGKSYL